MFFSIKPYTNRARMKSWLCDSVVNILCQCHIGYMVFGIRYK